MNIKVFILFPALLFAMGNLKAQDKVVEDTLVVKGVCKMCKERIEEAAYGKGVKFVSWEQATDKLAIAYRSDKTSLEQVTERLLSAGHQVGDQKPTSDNYGKLPNCCQYEGVEKH